MRAGVGLFCLVGCAGAQAALPRVLPAIALFEEPPAVAEGAAPFVRLRLEQAEDTEDEWPGDQFHLTVEDGEGRAHTMRFTASYGNVQVWVVPALPEGEGLLCMKVGRGRGTNVHSEYLSIFQWRPGGVQLVASVPLSWFDVDPSTDSYAHFVYDWSLGDRDVDGTLELTLIGTSEVTKGLTTIYPWLEGQRFFGPSSDGKPALLRGDRLWRAFGWVPLEE